MKTLHAASSLRLFFIAVNVLICCSAIAQKNNYSARLSNSKISYSSNTGQEYKIEYRGDVVLNDSDTEIVSVSDGGYVSIGKRTFGSSRKIVIESNGSGGLTKKYYVNGNQQDYDSEGKKWLEQVLPKVVTISGLGAASRLKRFYKKGGAELVLKELRKIESDSVKSIYFNLFLDFNLSPKELSQTIVSAGKTIDSDAELANLLRNHGQQFSTQTETISAFVEAAKSISSSANLSGILSAIVEDKTVSSTGLIGLLNIGYGISSDANLSNVLSDIVENRNLDQGLVVKMLDLLDEVGSDTNAASVYEQLARTEALNEQQVIATLKSAAKNIGSDSELANVLISFSKQAKTSETLKSSYRAIAKSIGSNAEYRNVINALEN